MKLTLITGLLLLSGSAVYAQAGSGSDLPLETTIDRVVVRADTSQSYAAYVPSSYSAKLPSAVIYCFDPLARGKFALGRFQPAAEKYGYIVVCSNNSHNGQDNDTAKQVIAALENDVRQRFNIDARRVYVAGFSGGARLAISLAVSCGKCAAGVLAVGAGFPPNIQPDAKLPFAFFGAVGLDDFNYPELRELQVKLESLSVSYRIETFAGGHEWLDQSTADQALAWFNLQAIKNGELIHDERVIGEEFQTRRVLAERSFQDSHFIDAYYQFLSLLRDFSDRSDLQPIRPRAEQIANSPEFRKEFRAERELASRQSRATEEIFSLWLRVPDPAVDLIDTKLQARDRISKLQKANDLPVDSPDRRLARRTLFGTFVGAIETGRSLLPAKKYSLAASYYELALAVRPRDGGIAFELARIYALDGKKKPALQSLEDAVSFGFTNLERIRTESAFSNLAKEPRFQKLLDRALP